MMDTWMPLADLRTDQVVFSFNLLGFMWYLLCRRSSKFDLQKINHGLYQIVLTP